MNEKTGKASTPRRFERQFKLSAVERMKAGESPTALARELGVRRKLLYGWKKRVEEGGPESLRSDGLPGPVPGGYAKPEVNDERRVAELERLLGKQQALIAFFENALQQVEAGTVGKAASTRPSGKSANEQERR
jgi:transposase